MLDDLRYRLRAIFRRHTVERELDDEVRFHIEQYADVEERSGVSRAEALRRARVAFGGVDAVKEASRDGRGVRLLETAWRDVRYAVRTLARTPAFTIVAILSLTLGIGANTAMFQVLNALLLRELPVAAPHELVEINLPEADLAKSRGNFPRWPAMPYPLYQELRTRQQGFSAMFAWADEWFNLAPAGEVRRAPGLWVSGEYFPALGLTPALGRLFGPEDDRPGCGIAGAVVSHDFWQRELRGDSGAIGRTISVHATQVPVIGVAPAGFTGLQVGHTFDVALPICSLVAFRPGTRQLVSGSNWWLTAVGRLKPGWTVPAADAHVRAIAPAVFKASLPPDYPAASVDSYLGLSFTATPAATGRTYLREEYGTPLRLLLGMTGFVLLIACANLPTLMLARGAVRQRELSLRLALGASRGRLVSQLLAESVVIAGAGAVTGALAAVLLSRGLVQLIATARNPIVLTLAPDWRVVAFLAVTGLAACVILGLAPALRASRGSPGDALRAGGRGVAGDAGGLRLRRGLVIGQVAVSLVLVVGAFLFARSFANLLDEDLGFRTERVTIVEANRPGPAPRPEADAAFKRELLASLRAMPGVESAAETFIIPLDGNNSASVVWLDGATRAEGREVSFNRVSSGYFDTLGMRVLAGRDIAESDTKETPFVAVVNESFVRAFLPGQNPVGRRLRVDASSSMPERVYEIVGLVADAKYRRLRDDARPVMTVAMTQRGGAAAGGIYLVRTSATVQGLTPTVRETLARLDPNLRFTVRGLHAEIRDSLLRDRAMALLSSLFGGLAALLAAIGLHGVAAYGIERRRREIGIRLALGADRRTIVASVLRENGRLIAMGLAAGIGLALLATDATRSLLFGLEPRDPVTVAAAVVALGGLALVASAIPARRAARVDPMATLKDD
jgi:putative ABC transport system permease protein